MSLRRTVLTALCLLGLASGAIADRADTRRVDEASEANVVAMPSPLTWVPNWLATSIGKAIADAKDPRERSTRAK